MAEPQTVVPMVAYEDAAAAIEWLSRAFGFREDPDERYTEDGRVTHAELDVGDGSVIYVANPTPDYVPPSATARNARSRPAGRACPGWSTVSPYRLPTWTSILRAPRLRGRPCSRRSRTTLRAALPRRGRRGPPLDVHAAEGRDRVSMSGSCHCGAVRFEVTEDFSAVRICHCTTCKKLSRRSGDDERARADGHDPRRRR